MWARLSIVAGLVIGVAVAGLLFGGILALSPDRLPSSSAAPSQVVASAGPTAHASAGASAVASPSAAASVSAAPSAPFHIGEPALALVVPKVGGGTIDLATLRGKPVWVNFMATWCPPCQDEIPLMTGYAERYAANGLTVIAVDVREDEAAVAAFAKGIGATFDFGLDTDGAAASEWDAVALPVHFWIDADGVIRHGALGGIGPDEMAKGLETILLGVDVTS